jgi:hypothetical protein
MVGRGYALKRRSRRCAPEKMTSATMRCCGAWLPPACASLWPARSNSARSRPTRMSASSPSSAKGQDSQHTFLGSECVPGLQRATEILSDVPKLLAQATDQERRVLLIEIFDDIYLTPHQAMAVRPAAAYTDILKALDQSSAFNHMFVWWAGWASNLRNEPFLTKLFEQLKAPRRFCIAA